MRNKFLSFLNIIFGSWVLLVFSSCAVGPNHKKPEVAELTPKEWRWDTAAPQAELPKGEWWKIFNDSALNELETLALEKNQDLQAAMARVEQSRASVKVSQSRFFPELSLNPYARREQTSGNLPTPIPVNVPSGNLNTFSTPLDVSYEIDLWGRLRRLAESAQAQEKATAADAENMRLILCSDIASNYFLFRTQENEIAALKQMVTLKEKTLEILKQQMDVGMISETDVLTAENELGQAQAGLAQANQRQAKIINALALLCGSTPDQMNLPESLGIHEPKPVPAGLPSELLKRRPDVSRAEFLLAVKSAEIGAAKAEFFPALKLTAQGGFLSNEAENLIEQESRVWSLTPSVNWTLFNAGKTEAEVKRAKTAWKEALAQYRQTVLSAFKEVEDALAQIRYLDEETEGQTKSYQAAARSSRLIQTRFESGTLSFLEVAEAEKTKLLQETEAHRLQGERLSARIRLIKALGGSWNTAAEKNQQ